MPFIVKNTTLPSPLDLLAPHSCRGCGSIGAPLCNRCKKYIANHPLNVCPSCKIPTQDHLCHHCPDLPPTYIVGERDKLIGLLIHDYKFKSIRALAKPLAELCNSTLPNINGEASIIPLPTINQHIRARGLDHTRLIAKHLAKLRGPHYHTEQLLIRAKNTVQVGTDRTTRIKQADSAYQLNPKCRITKDTTYILLDDVWTTGASMRASIKKLREAGANQIIILILALSRI